MNLTAEQLRKLAELKERAEAINTEMLTIIGEAKAIETKGEHDTVEKLTPTGRRPMSAASRARIAAGARKRWARVYAAEGRV